VGDGGVVGAVAVDRDVPFFSVPERPFGVSVAPSGLLYEIVRPAFTAFRADAEAVPALTLRGGNALDGYDEAHPFDPANDEPTMSDHCQ
jgi:hypothetical protein